MNEPELYDSIGSWLIGNKGCQKNKASEAYTTKPNIPPENGSKSRKPDVVGVQYELTDRKPPVTNFHYYFVSVKPGVDTGQLSNIVGGIKKLQQNNGSTVAADSAEYYFALPEDELLYETLHSLKQNGIGILRIDNENKSFTIQETLAAETQDYQQRSRLSNGDMESPGNFRKKLEQEVWDNPPVLKKVLHPTDYFEEVLRPAQDEYDNHKTIESLVDSLDNESAKQALKRFLSAMENAGLEAYPAGSDPPHLRLTGSENELILIPQLKNFKILYEDREMLFRISGTQEFEGWAVKPGDHAALRAYCIAYLNGGL